MKIIEKKSKKSTYILDLIIEKKDYVEKVDSTLKNYRKKQISLVLERKCSCWIDKNNMVWLLR